MRDAIQRLPLYIHTLFVDPASTPHDHFWMRCDFDHRRVIAALRRDWPKFAVKLQVHYLHVLAGFSALIQDSLRREREVQHFETHVALAKTAAAWPQRTHRPHAWRLESVLFGRMLETRYRDPLFKTKLEWLRHSTTIGPLPPWEAPQRSFQFGRPVENKTKLDLRDAKGYWVGLRLCELDETTDFSHDS